jgi:hypothetical protein
MQKSEAECGLRYDKDKPRFDLLPAYPMFQLARLFSVGAEKYDVRNWEKGMEWSKVLSPLLRHVFKYMGGEDNDPETELSHMTHVAWNALILLEYERLYRSLDDRTNNKFRFLDEQGNETERVTEYQIQASKVSESMNKERERLILKGIK